MRRTVSDTYGSRGGGDEFELKELREHWNGPENVDLGTSFVINTVTLSCH